ncbi:MAG: endonuclease/exonuclease/phosphatase family protein [Deltaproteobacteria bacterium]|nr:endonuclease/exonuclease/phosphatase family protein [Deltaproteobacteria bacterium]
MYIRLAALLLAAGCAQATRRPREPAPGVFHLEVMSYNVNYGLAGDASIIRVIRDADCDLVLLQETTPAWEDAIRKELGGQYAYIDFRHGRGAGGLGVLSKLRFTPGELIEPPEGGWFPAWRLLLDSPAGEIQVLNLHLRPPVSDSGSVVSGYFETDAIRARQMAHYLERLDPDLPTLIAGDFNESRTGDAVARLRQRGYRSALPEFSPYQATWRWHTSVGTVSSQLDHIAYDRRLTPVDVRVLPAGRSDHLPLVGIFELRGER